ncbi:hypothetical protein Mpop_2743 [Methylorubrum populi BJ001]|jgi:hypothetical protein|uniref:Uncharacterized protein n=1 Tax=Methylorubrum populi (strain ATCC BAA-705 / NCIMB 13946 / BJ001) TaxID=441620 RepID=B1ZD29_METPB|nr:hypothetical protein [Methylorubrum populi]ACB80898.1 hypothetical protein Mpop_2743 [Methylorubrum populi BJ001]
MSASTKCPHSDLHFHLNIANLVDANVKAVDLTCSCKICGTPMRFLGMPHGVSMAQPTMSVDGLEARFPLVARNEEPSTAISAIINMRTGG